MSDVRIENDLRQRFGPSRDQGPRPTCLAFAVSDTHAAVRDGWDPLSCEYLFYHAIKRDGSGPKKGASVTAILAAVETDGQPVEAGWAYLSKTPSDLKRWKPPAITGPLFHRTGETVTDSFDGAWTLIQNGRPAIVAMTFSDAFYVPKKGIIDAVEPVDPIRRHAVVAVATGRTSGSRLMMVRNSWGVHWGDAGHAWLAESYLKPRVMKVFALKEAA